MSGRLKVCVHILTDLLDYVRSGAGEGIRTTPTPLRLDALCDRIARDLEANYPGSRVEVQIKGDGAGAWDEQRLTQALSNLISNAIKYGSKDSPVGVDVNGTSDWVFRTNVTSRFGIVTARFGPT